MPRKSKRQEAAEQKRKIDGMFHEYHELGAKTHGFAWMRMNQLMLTAARLCDIRYENQPYKTLLTVCAMKALNQMPGESLADRPAASQGAPETRWIVAKAIWENEAAEAILKKAFPRGYEFAKWPDLEESLRQPYCQSTYRAADAVLAVLAASQPPQELEGLRSALQGLADALEANTQDGEDGKGYWYRLTGALQLRLEQARAALTRGEVGR